MADGFLSRWSQRKQAVREGQTLVEPPAPATPPSSSARELDKQKSAKAPAALAGTGSQQDQSPAAGGAAAPERVLPTLEDVKQLTPESDFSSFVAQGVSPEVRNAAVKKLFADPRYSMIDGMDIYLEDYSLPSPLSAAMLAKMVSAKTLRLVEDPDEQQASAQAQAAQASDPAPQAEDAQSAANTPEDQGSEHSGAAPQAETQSSAQPTGENHDDSDLRLQPNHAAVGDDAERGT